jgi:alginate O-acetyltransferase complex protein AlgI
MIFDSLEFALFLGLAFALYWAMPARRLRAQNLLVLALSYFFYGWWDWRFLSLIAISSVVDFFAAQGIERATAQARRRLLLITNLATNLGMLAYYKYADFFADSLAQVAAQVGVELSWSTLHVVLPVGISFYTFQTLSYTLDVYHGSLKATRDPIAFFAYVSFFPQLVAGPIERGARLLPQFQKERRFDAEAAGDGCRRILWGLFKKVVVADSAATIVDAVFAQHGELAAGWLVIAAVAFSIQIYGDFSGYSDVAIGLARLFGFQLSDNFRYPFFARNIAEFWQRWHISLSSWFRDYVYIPLGGSRVGTPRHFFNVLLVFLVSGLWHGANWTFVVWGLIHAILFIPLAVFARRAKQVVASGHGLGDALRICVTFALVTFAFVVFRSESIAGAGSYLFEMITSTHAFSIDDLHGYGVPRSAVTLCGLTALVMLAVEWRNQRQPHGLCVQNCHWAIRWPAYYALIFAIAVHFDAQRPFVYFQF